MTWKMIFRGSDNSVKGLMLEKSFFLAMYTKGKGQEYMDFLTFALNGWWTEYIDILQKNVFHCSGLYFTKYWNILYNMTNG